jgi:hypothetical protein
MYSTYFFDDGAYVREVLFIFDRWPKISADYFIKLGVRLGLDVGV